MYGILYPRISLWSVERAVTLYHFRLASYKSLKLVSIAPHLLQFGHGNPSKFGTKTGRDKFLAWTCNLTRAHAVDNQSIFTFVYLGCLLTAIITLEVSPVYIPQLNFHFSSMSGNT